MRRVLTAFVVACALAAPALAQNLTLRAPDWATRLVAADLLPTTGGRPVLAADGVDLSVRVTTAPYQGGVARVVRYDSGPETNRLALRRFTGHPSTGWWLWGPDTPVVSTPAAATRAEIDRLARSALTTAAIGSDGNASCPTGERIYVEIYADRRSASATRSCMGSDAIGALARRVSDLGGSRTEEELAAAARRELLDVDRAFNALAQAEGVRAAFARYAAQNGKLFRSGQTPAVGPQAIAGEFSEGARLVWAPEDAQVSTRGDMGWTWGRATYTNAAGESAPTQYVTVWTRDFEGEWRFVADVGIAGWR